VHSKNPGIAFSIFADANSQWVRFALIAAICGHRDSCLVLVAAKGVSPRAAAGLALLLGGATGNLTDRILHGAVTDFFEVLFGAYRYPAFNVADSAITIGAILILPRRGLSSEESFHRKDSSLDTTWVGAKRGQFLARLIGVRGYFNFLES